MSKPLKLDYRHMDMHPRIYQQLLGTKGLSL